MTREDFFSGTARTWVEHDEVRLEIPSAGIDIGLTPDGALVLVELLMRAINALDDQRKVRSTESDE